MKFFLILLCFFGAVFAEQSQNQWVKKQIDWLTESIKCTNTTVNIYSGIGLYYFSDRYSALLPQMEQIRTEMKQLPVEKSNVIHQSASHLVITYSSELDQILKRFDKDLKRLEEEQDVLTEEYRHERKKVVALLAAAEQLNGVYDAKMPEPQKLIGDVKAIIAQENAIKQADETNKPRLMAELDNQYQTIAKVLRHAETVMIEQNEYHYRQVLPKARLFIALLRNNATPDEIKQADMLQEALDLSLQSTIETYRLVPIQSAETVEVFLDRAWADKETAKKLDSLLKKTTVAVSLNDLGRCMKAN